MSRPQQVRGKRFDPPGHFLAVAAGAATTTPTTLHQVIVPAANHHDYYSLVHQQHQQHHPQVDNDDGLSGHLQHCIHGLAQTHQAMRQMYSDVSPNATIDIASTVCMAASARQLAIKKMQLEHQTLQYQQGNQERRHQETLQVQRHDPKWRSRLEEMHGELLQSAYTAWWTVALSLGGQVAAQSQLLQALTRGTPLTYFYHQLVQSIIMTCAAASPHHDHHSSSVTPAPTAVEPSPPTWFGMSTLWTAFSSRQSSRENTVYYSTLGDYYTRASQTLSCAGTLLIYVGGILAAIGLSYVLDKVPVFRGWVSFGNRIMFLILCANYCFDNGAQVQFMMVFMAVVGALLWTVMATWHCCAKAKMQELIRSRSSTILESNSSSRHGNNDEQYVPSETDTESFRDEVQQIQFGLGMAQFLCMAWFFLCWYMGKQVE